MLSREQITQAVGKAAHRYPVSRVYLFGSYASGTATEQSDVDLYVEFDHSPVSFYQVAGFRGALEELLRVPVDVVKRRPAQTEAPEMVCIYDR